MEGEDQGDKEPQVEGQSLGKRNPTLREMGKEEAEAYWAWRMRNISFMERRG